MSLTSASGRIVRVLCALLCGSAVFASPADRRTSAYYAHLDLTSTFDYFDNSWLKSEHHHQSPAAAPTWTPLEATIAGGNRSPETDEISAVPAAGTATLDLDVSYEYDLRGDRKVKNDASGTANDATYDYDLDDRLTAETRGGPGGVGITYGYAKRGDLTTKTVGSATTTYLTDHMGRITALLGGGEHWHYTYAPTGDRFSKEDVTIPGSGDMEVYLSSDGDTLIEYTKTGTGTLVFSGIYASPGVDGRVSRVDDFGETSYYFGDALQSVHQVTDGTGEVKRWQFTDAWGNDLYVGKVNTPMGAGDRYGFQGRESDSEGGLQHFRARSYDPMTGRFTSRDPVSSTNRYSFVSNNPPNATDPSGQLIRFANTSDRSAMVGTTKALSVWLGIELQVDERGFIHVAPGQTEAREGLDKGTLPRDVLHVIEREDVNWTVEKDLVRRVNLFNPDAYLLNALINGHKEIASKDSRPEDAPHGAYGEGAAAVTDLLYTGSAYAPDSEESLESMGNYVVDCSPLRGAFALIYGSAPTPNSYNSEILNSSAPNAGIEGIGLAGYDVEEGSYRGYIVDYKTGWGPVAAAVGVERTSEKDVEPIVMFDLNLSQGKGLGFYYQPASDHVGVYGYQELVHGFGGGAGYDWDLKKLKNYLAFDYWTGDLANPSPRARINRWQGR